MKRISFGSIVRGFVFCLALAVFAGVVLPPSAVKGSGFGACALALHDAVLSLLTSADGDPERTRVSKYGALWTKDSDLADTIVAGSHAALAGSGTSFALPAGTREFYVGISTVGGSSASATGYVAAGFGPAAKNYLITPEVPLGPIRHFAAPALTTTVYVQPGANGGTIQVRYWYTVSQNPG